MELANAAELNQQHDKAMELAALAELARMRGNDAEMQQLFRQAFDLEKAVALQIAETTLEPSRSVLLRSAAWLAFHCGEIREAEILAAQGLAGIHRPKLLKNFVR